MHLSSTYFNSSRYLANKLSVWPRRFFSLPISLWVCFQEQALLSCCIVCGWDCCASCLRNHPEHCCFDWAFSRCSWGLSTSHGVWWWSFLRRQALWYLYGSYLWCCIWWSFPKFLKGWCVELFSGQFGECSFDDFEGFSIKESFNIINGGISFCLKGKSIARRRNWHWWLYLTILSSQPHPWIFFVVIKTSVFLSTLQIPRDDLGWNPLREECCWQACWDH